MQTQKTQQALSHPFALWRKARVSSDAAQLVQLALPMPAEVDGAWCDVDVHEVVHYTALDMVLNPVHQISGAHVEDLNVGHIPNVHKIGSGRKNWLKYTGNLYYVLFLRCIWCILTCPFHHQGKCKSSCSIQCASESPPAPRLYHRSHSPGYSVSLPVIFQRKIDLNEKCFNLNA